MYKHEIAPGMIRYSFDPLPGSDISNSVYAFVSDGEALLIDSGWEHEGAQIAEDFKQNGLDLAGVIISHFHDDHMQGLKALPKAPVYGSEHYQATLDMWTDKDEHKHYIPSVIINEPYSMDFAEHSIRMIPFPGHSACTLLTQINGVYLHIADELLFSTTQEPILPCADPGCIKRHAESLKRLKAYSSHVFLPSHGEPLSGADDIERETDKRLTYFNAILRAGKSISYEEATKDSGGFLHSEWHENNC